MSRAIGAHVRRSERRAAGTSTTAVPGPPDLVLFAPIPAYLPGPPWMHPPALTQPDPVHTEPHLCDAGFCHCGCDDCTYQVRGGCGCGDCRCGWWETEQENPSRDPEHLRHERHHLQARGRSAAPARLIEAEDIAGFGPLIFNGDGTTTFAVHLQTGEVLDVPGIWEQIEGPR